MTDALKDALEEALLDHTPPWPGAQFPLIVGEAEEVGDAILAHPAMQEQARLAAIGAAVERLGPEFTVEAYSRRFFQVAVRDSARIVARSSGFTLEAAINAALEDEK